MFDGMFADHLLPVMEEDFGHARVRADETVPAELADENAARKLVNEFLSDGAARQVESSGCLDAVAAVCGVLRGIRDLIPPWVSTNPAAWKTSKVVELDIGDGQKRYYVNGAPPEVVFLAIGAVQLAGILKRHVANRSFDPVKTALFAGALGGQIEAVRLAQFNPLVVAEQSRRKGASKGGAATRKLTPEVEKIARKILAEMQQSNISNDAAYQRTSAKLKSEHQITVSKDTLKRHLSKPAAQQ